MTLREYLRVSEHTHLTIKNADHLTIIGDHIIDTLNKSVVTNFKPNYAFLRFLNDNKLIPDFKVFADEFDTLVLKVIKDLRETIYMETYINNNLNENPIITFFEHYKNKKGFSTICTTTHMYNHNENLYKLKLKHKEIITYNTHGDIIFKSNYSTKKQKLSWVKVKYDQQGRKIEEKYSNGRLFTYDPINQIPIYTKWKSIND